MKKTVNTFVFGFLIALTGQVPAQDLMDVYRQALEKDPQLAAAAAANRAAKVLDEQARAAVMPKASVSGQYGSQNTENNIDGSTRSSKPTAYGLSLQQPVYNRQAFVAMDQAEARINQADAEFVSVQQGTILRVAQAYFNLLAAQDSLEFAQAEKKAVGQQLRQTQQRFDVGLTAITDVREAQARYDLTIAQEIVARNQLDTAREQLRELTDQAYQDVATLGDVPLEIPEPRDIDAWVKTALDQNLQLLAAQSGVEQARLEIDRRKAARWPTVDVVGSYDHSERTIGSFTTDTDSTSVLLQLNVPFYQGGLISAQAKEAAYLKTQAQQGLEQQRRATVRQTRDAYLGVQAGISRVQALRQSLTSAETALEATRAGFEVGTRTAVDVLNSQQELFRARRDYARARYDYVLSRLNLKQAAGVLTEEDLERINSWLEPAE